MHVELEQVVGRVIDEIKCTILLALDTENELEWPAGLVAGREGNVDQLSMLVGHVFTSLTTNKRRTSVIIADVCAAHGKPRGHAVPAVET